MNHAITVGGLLLGLSAVVGFCLLAFGVLQLAAASMSDAPSQSASATKSGWRRCRLWCRAARRGRLGAAVMTDLQFRLLGFVGLVLGIAGLFAASIAYWRVALRPGFRGFAVQPISVVWPLRASIPSRKETA